MPQPGFHLLNGRDNTVMQWVFEHADGDPEEYRELMLSELGNVEQMLSTKSLSYGAFKSALVPPRDGFQIAFVFDWYAFGGFYGDEFSNWWLPLLRPNISSSAKHGDLLSGGRPDELMDSEVHRATALEIDWGKQYAVYFNNLKLADVTRMHEGLMRCAQYRGYLDVTFASPIRNYLAGCLAPLGLLAGGVVLLDHGGDEPFIGNQNEIGYEFEKHDIRVVSFVSDYFAPFFTYKIERDDGPSFDPDVALSLAAVTGQAIDVRTARVVVPLEKLEKYLLVDESKLRLMRSIGLENVSANELADEIRHHLSMNYVYNLRFAADGTPTFAVSAEFEKPNGDLTRRLLALKYDSTANQISLVTMY